MVDVFILYVEELKATIRGRFAWLGIAVVLFALGVLATVATQDTWLDGYGIVAYFLVPLTFIPLSAGLVASPRANRFVESVFTAPVDRGTWLLAKVLVLLTLASAYFVALLPMLAVYVAHVGLPALLSRLLVWAPLLMAVSIAVGVLIGVLFIGRSIAAPAATGMGVMLIYAALVPLQELLAAQGNGASRSGHVALASPAVLLKNGLGFALAIGTVPATTMMTWVSVGIVAATAAALAAWIFLRAQGVETWEASRAQRWTIGVCVCLLVVLPTVLADVNYDKVAPPINNAPAIRGVFSRAGSSLGLAVPGGRLGDRCCSTILNRDEWPSIGTDALTHRDLFVMLPVDASQHILDLTAEVAGANGLEAQIDRSTSTPLLQALEVRTYSGDSGPVGADGKHIASGWVLRVPITLNPTHPWDTGGMRYPIDVALNYRLSGDSAPKAFRARAAIEAQISSAGYQMGAASMTCPVLCFLASFLRWRRTR